MREALSKRRTALSHAVVTVVSLPSGENTLMNAESCDESSFDYWAFDGSV
jgi:hypothetical protein